ncbi:MAG: putative ABC transporter permease [Bacilli bacterium]|nr:putative ABC transporter permease [Bacilli bacterium]
MNVFFKYFWLFTFGSFVGFIIETIWCLIRNKKIESRKGLIYGYFTPVYGVSAIFITLAYEILSFKNIFAVFVLTFIISFLVEYVSSFLQEKCFGTKSWDYSNFPLNINGRVNIIYMLGFSICGILWINIYPIFLEKIYYLLNYFNLFNIVSIIMIIYMIYNCFISIVASYRQKMRRNGKIASNKFTIWLDKKYNDEFMKKIYANATFVK